VKSKRKIPPTITKIARKSDMRLDFASKTSSLLIFLLATAAATLSMPNAFAEVCGDAIPDPFEECDDGNTVSGDGCSATCKVEDEHSWTQFLCLVAAVTNSADELLAPGDNMFINNQNALPGDPSASGPTDNGIAGVFNSPGETSVSYLRTNAGQATGEATDKVQRLDDGTVDFLAVGGFGTGLLIGDWNITAFFAEFRDDSGAAINGVENWPGPEFNYDAFNASQCAADFENINTQETARVTGTVVQVSNITIRIFNLDVARGDKAGLIAAVEFANRQPSGSVTNINLTGPENDFKFERSYGTFTALPEIESHVVINGAGVFRRIEASLSFGFASVVKGGRLDLINDSSSLAKISNFESLLDGGAIDVLHGQLIVKNWIFSDNSSPQGSGGAINATDSFLEISDCTFFDNEASDFGGAVFIDESSHSVINNSVFSQNEAEEGCDIAADTESDFSPPTVIVDGTAFTNSECVGFRANLRNAYTRLQNLTINGNGNGAIKPVGGKISWSGNAALIYELVPQQSINQLQSNSSPKSKIAALCESGEPGSIVSLGYNIASDDSCNLDQPTDLPNTDPMLSAPDENGLQTPLPGSPAIDSGATDVIVFEGDTLASLPCGYRDLKGTARPQDANGDGVFECDRGAIEVPGAGDIVAGHSGAFFNPARNGEGNYVEILNDQTAVVYTFTFRPDGSGLAWFTGLGEVSGNSIIIDKLFRPLGTSFGDGFNQNDIEFTPIGGMSMVFPDCEAVENPGNIAYSGEPLPGFEGLISKASRLTSIAGCGGETPSPKAGLSGSYYAPSRNGEGIIVEWLTDGQVLVVFFTFDQDGNQLWLLGVGTPNGNSVTMDALYPSAYTRWGRNFSADEVNIDTWGTFTVSWTDCNSVTFDYASSVDGYGSATRQYTRLSSLQGTSCPGF
jgi:cysteine-rich repeat protein/predicted outer membrane repeat protein